MTVGQVFVSRDMEEVGKQIQAEKPEELEGVELTCSKCNLMRPSLQTVRFIQ